MAFAFSCQVFGIEFFPTALSRLLEPLASSGRTPPTDLGEIKFAKAILKLNERAGRLRHTG